MKTVDMEFAFDIMSSRNNEVARYLCMSIGNDYFFFQRGFYIPISYLSML